MAAEPVLYGLYWRASPRCAEAPVALSVRNVLGGPAAVPAVILYPALLTPAVHVRDPDPEKDRFEILVTAPDMDGEKFLQQVNTRLRVSRGLDGAKPLTYRPLSQDPAKEIEVLKLPPPDGNGILRTPGGFRGILHPRFAFKCGLGAFYSVRISASCLEKAVVPGPLPPSDPAADTQDAKVQEILKRLNGPALKGKDGFGTHCFAMDGGKLNLAMVDRDQPIRAHHPLFVYPRGALVHANLGHASDVHMNARQDVLRQSDARVIDGVEGGGGGDGVSPRLGSLVNVYSANFTSILNGLAAAGADVMLLGGDLVDHARNCFPYASGGVPAQGNGSAGKVWKHVDLRGDGYASNYHAFVDLVSFYSVVRHFTATALRPVYVVAGNHDAYEHAYGISPRVAGLRANEGVPADHNLTFYEAMLLFGESYGEVKKKLNFNPALFEWFFNVLTPFSDYGVELPNQRIVGLHWGEKEWIGGLPYADPMGKVHLDGHGLAHLPRATEAVSPAQLALAREVVDGRKKAVVFSHFTFVSYDDKIPESAEIKEPVPGSTGFAYRFTRHDLGTFEQGRAELYALVTAPERAQCVLSGHSHRKGLYRATAGGGGFATEMWPVPMWPKEGRAPPDGCTPVVVSDSAGPLPRLNLRGEFRGWGSDRPAGTLVKVSDRGEVESVVAIPATTPQSRPRIAVALEYTHVLQKALRLEDDVLGLIETLPYSVLDRYDEEHGVRFQLGKVVSDLRITIESAELYSWRSDKGEWVRVLLEVAKPREEGKLWKSEVVIGRVPRESNRAFLEWLGAPTAGRFMSLRFRPGERASGRGAKERTHEVLMRYNWSSPWNFEIDTSIKLVGALRSRVAHRMTPRCEAPSFDWRKRFARYGT